MTDAWTFQKNVNIEGVLHFLRCIEDIIDAVVDLKDAEEHNAQWKAISSIEHISVSLRKLVFDKNGGLFERCFADPNFHPLKRPSPNEKTSIFVENIKTFTLTVKFADGGQTTVEVPDYQQKTTIYPLYGMRRDGDHNFNMEMPFDNDAHPIKFKKWMNMKVLQIDDMMFTAKDLLRVVANNEGAHIGDGVKLTLPDASSWKLDDQKNKRYKVVNAVKFGGLSCAQHFTLWTGLYIAHRSKTLIDALPLDKDAKAIAEICKKIEGGPKTLRGRGPMENQTHHGLALDSNRKLRSECIGDYSIVLKIP